MPVYFYPRSPCGERLNPLKTLVVLPKFLSTLSLRRATTRVTSSAGTIGISIHALLAESDLAPCTAIASRSDISIHALLAESDGREPALSQSSEISIHALLAESDALLPTDGLFFFYFYPRSPCGERRYRSCVSLVGCAYFYPRSPCGERPEV